MSFEEWAHAVRERMRSDAVLACAHERVLDISVDDGGLGLCWACGCLVEGGDRWASMC